ncbi:hypothetical protein AVDCRST_MAG81-1088, partial [uncultured Synechococcales cyanobacterium]
WLRSRQQWLRLKPSQIRFTKVSRLLSPAILPVVPQIAHLSQRNLFMVYPTAALAHGLVTRV